MPSGTGSLTWTGPIGGNFDALTLWSESSHQHNFGGQAALSVDGVFFLPSAPFNFTGQSSQDNTANAQFIVNKLSLSGRTAREHRAARNGGAFHLAEEVRMRMKAFDGIK